MCSLLLQFLQLASLDKKINSLFANGQAEARKLALTADHADSAKGAQFSGLSIWVALTTFFSNSAERNRAKDVIQAAKEQEERKAH